MRRAKVEVGPWDEIRDRVFRLRCESKEGRTLSETDQRFLDAAFRAHAEEYATLGPLVFEATKPFGA
jgi:hypothetical protein